MREEINAECEYWRVIIGFRHKNPKGSKTDTRGYYLCDTHDKMEEYCRNMYAQAKNMREQADMAKTMYNSMNTKQIKFNFEDA